MDVGGLAGTPAPVPSLEGSDMVVGQRLARVLVANRGEIAVRVIRACRTLGISTVAVYAPGEEHARHVELADDARRLPPPRPGGPAVPYLDIDGIVAIARQSGADAVHPGYGFLAENVAFARACATAGLVFVGPSADAIAAMGDKVEARRIARAAGVPVVEGTTEPVASVEEARRWADEHGYPVAVKAAGGGGGRGFRVAHSADGIEDAFTGSSGEAARFFANPAVYLERYIAAPRHIEIQIMADAHGNAVSLGERDCSIQRRHQKLIEEAPSPVVNDDVRRRMGEAAIALARATGYVGAGTVEYLLDAEGAFSFLEMNTRIQVEHPVTELVTGIDLVREQLLVAGGAALSFTADDICRRGHAIECRINAEDPAHGFAPSPGTITAYREPGGFGVRVDAATSAGTVISPDYDSLVAKLVVWGWDRPAAMDRMAAALAEMRVAGVTTTIPLHERIMAEPDFRAGRATTAYLPEHQDLLADLPGAAVRAKVAANGSPPEMVLVEVNGRRLEVTVHGEPLAAGPAPARSGARRPAAGRSGSRRDRDGAAPRANGPELTSAVQGNVVRVLVAEGDQVTAGQNVVVVSAMKMENEIAAGRSGRVTAVHVVAGDAVSIGSPLVTIEPEKD